MVMQKRTRRDHSRSQARLRHGLQMVQTRIARLQRDLVRHEAQDQEGAEGSRAHHQSFQLSVVDSVGAFGTSAFPLLLAFLAFLSF